MSLHAVEDGAGQMHEDRVTNPVKIPMFEGQAVEQTKAKITSVSGLEIEDRVFRVDEYVRMYVEGRVIAIDHKVNQTTGQLERVHLIKAIDTKVVDWEDPDGSK